MDNNASIADLRSAQDTGLNAGIRADLQRRFAWPSALMPLTRPLRDLEAAIDCRNLSAVAAAIHNEMQLAFAIVSKEYIHTGLNWAYAMHKIGLSNFFVIAGDTFTAHEFNKRGIPNVLAEIDESDFDPAFVSATGFPTKGLAVNAFKFPVAHFLLQSGYSVILSDADAIWLGNPMPYLQGVDFAFQRVVYHPPSIARLWGFAACSGFLYFRRGSNTVSFAERCIEAQRLVFCDQLAVNLALLEGEPDWCCKDADWRLPARDILHDRSDLEVAFAKCAKSPISGKLRQGGLGVLALPHDKFWRHACVSTSLLETVVCHPNSPKDDLEKIKIFKAMGLQFAPGGC